MREGGGGDGDNNNNNRRGNRNDVFVQVQHQRETLLTVQERLHLHDVIHIHTVPQTALRKALNEPHPLMDKYLEIRDHYHRQLQQHRNLMSSIYDLLPFPEYSITIAS